MLEWNPSSQQTVSHAKIVLQVQLLMVCCRGKCCYSDVRDILQSVFE